MDFLGIGPLELLLVLFVALLVLGPGKLPEMARTLGRAVRQLRKVMSEATKDVRVELEEPRVKPGATDSQKYKAPGNTGPHEP
ncbi:MAG: twin-arginine translocase subunit TatB [Chloroflexi bacterium]|nr:twin-arginine translocase subunit TatB [Chloroflexota bacterium]